MFLQCSHCVSFFGQLLLSGFEKLLKLGGRLAQVFGQLLLLLQTLLEQQDIGFAHTKYGMVGRMRTNESLFHAPNTECQLIVIKQYICYQYIVRFVRSLNELKQ